MNVCLLPIKLRSVRVIPQCGAAGIRYLHQGLTLLAADLLVIIHFGFILFVIFGGLLALKYQKTIWLHLPALIWGVLIEFKGWICPLTVYENEMRITNGGGYSTGFIEHYLMPIIYPPELTREIQFVLGLLLIALNAGIYWKLIRKWRDESSQ